MTSLCCLFQKELIAKNFIPHNIILNMMVMRLLIASSPTPYRGGGNDGGSANYDISFYAYIYGFWLWKTLKEVKMKEIDSFMGYSPAEIEKAINWCKKHGFDIKADPPYLSKPWVSEPKLPTDKLQGEGNKVARYCAEHGNAIIDLCLAAHHAYVERVRGKLSVDKIVDEIFHITEFDIDKLYRRRLAIAIHRLITEALGKGANQ